MPRQSASTQQEETTMLQGCLTHSMVNVRGSLWDYTPNFQQFVQAMGQPIAFVPCPHCHAERKKVNDFIRRQNENTHLLQDANNVVR